jgi:hypothetical protein
MATALGRIAWTVGGLVLNQLDDNGVTWAVEKTQGWYYGAPVRLRNTPKGQDSGDNRSKSRRGSKTIVLAGWIKAPTIALAEAARNAITALQSGDQFQLIWATPNSARYALVEFSDAPLIDPTGDGRDLDFQLTLLQVDPDRYYWDANAGAPISLTAGPIGVPSNSSGLDYVTGGGLDYVTGGGLNYGTVTSTGVVALTNPGTATAWPVFTFAGPLTTPAVTDQASGSQLAYTGAALAAGETLVVDTKARTVLRNGVNRRRELTVAQFNQMTIAAGGTKTYVLSSSNASDTGTVTVSITPGDR